MRNVTREVIEEMDEIVATTTVESPLVAALVLLIVGQRDAENQMADLLQYGIAKR